jgi:excinuclease ABC subunit C
MQRDDLQKFDLPETPGIYRFQKGGKILYIGKATVLRDRVRSYFNAGLQEARSTAIAAMVQEADTITWEEADSVLEAMILEANLIKKHTPPYNIIDKNNRSFNYLVVTEEEFPRLLVVRGREYFTNWQGGKVKQLFGPFPQGMALREAMKLVRRIFPYRDDKCTPCSQQITSGKTNCKPCFNRQIGLCPGVCTGETDAQEYADTVRNICLLFSGKKKTLVKELEKEMKVAAKEERFEDAERARRQVGALTHINDIALIKDDSRISSGGNIPQRGARIEAFDIAHTSGTETVGVMVAVEEGEPLKSAYRKFKVKGFTNNDPGALTEVLSRRLLHPEWQYPRVIVVDGSTAQMNAAKKVLSKAGITIPLVGVVKNERHRPERLIGNLNAIQSFERDILLANSEAHRFAINYHRKRRQATSIV